MIGELVARGHADAPRRARRVDEIDAGDLGLFAAVFGVRRNLQRFAVRTQRRTAAFVKPFGSGPDGAGRRTSSFDSPAIHAHAVGGRLARGVHRLAVLGARQVSESGAADEAVGGIVRMVDGR